MFSYLLIHHPLSLHPLFHLLPLAVILVLVSSWIYLTKNVARRPYRISTVKVSESRRRRARRRARSKSSQGFLEPIKEVFNKINDALFSSGGGSFVQQRLSFSNVALENIVMVLTIFLISAILLAVLVYPTLFTHHHRFLSLSGLEFELKFLKQQNHSK